jgi:transcriptional regulator GlxA family with amidase domain
LRRRELFDDAMVVIEREFATRLTLGAVARRIGASTRNLQRAFAEAENTTFSRKLREVRLARGAALLEQSSLPVKAVAHAVGYRQQAEFARQFRARYGHPPTVYRESWRAAQRLGRLASRRKGSESTVENPV